ncbi:unnamed protein product [Pedinophyceae sp. YPF-701]|nr:unnamed protein product [Pedinophyceae sp. YPF-701]
MCALAWRPGRATETVAAPAQPPAAPNGEDWVPVMLPEDLPKGVRKEVMVAGTSVLLFWYRNEVFCIESRSPAEGAYSEGFIRAKFTQDYGIECTTTGSIFSLKTGEALDLYPTNPVLKALTPVDSVRKLQIFPVKVQQDAIYVDVSVGPSQTFKSRGGSDSSIDKNNVYSLEPKMYLEGASPDKPYEQEGEGGSLAGKAVVAVAWSLVALAVVASVYASVTFLIENA